MAFPSLPPVGLGRQGAGARQWVSPRRTMDVAVVARPAGHLQGALVSDPRRASLARTAARPIVEIAAQVGRRGRSEILTQGYSQWSSPLLRRASGAGLFSGGGARACGGTGFWLSHSGRRNLPAFLRIPSWLRSHAESGARAGGLAVMRKLLGSWEPSSGRSGFCKRVPAEIPRGKSISVGYFWRARCLRGAISRMSCTGTTGLIPAPF